MPAPTGSCGERAATVEFISNIIHQNMAKETIQDEAKETGSQEPRRLNMEEKHKLEKLLLTDIDSAVGQYEKQTSAQRSELIGKLTKNPPAEVKRLFESPLLAQKQKEQIASKLHAAGYDIAYDGKLRVRFGGEVTPQLQAFNDRAEEMLQSLKSLKRNYVIKLFADHADTQSLFASLAKDLERLIG
jgi:hypothetical protein